MPLPPPGDLVDPPQLQKIDAEVGSHPDGDNQRIEIQRQIDRQITDEIAQQLTDQGDRHRHT